MHSRAYAGDAGTSRRVDAADSIADDLLARQTAIGGVNVIDEQLVSREGRHVEVLAAGGEHEEWTELYPAFAATAREEGFVAVATVFEKICIAEKQHEKRYNDLASNIENGRVFKLDRPVVWRCLNCGYLHEGPEAPEECPACAHPQAYFELLGENW